MPTAFDLCHGLPSYGHTLRQLRGGLRDFGGRSGVAQPPPVASAQPQLIDEVKALELECRKAELLLNLQRTRSAAAALELSTMETEDQVRRNKRSLSDDLERGSAEKQRQLKTPRTDSKAKDSGNKIITGNQDNEVHNEVPNTTTSDPETPVDTVPAADAPMMDDTTKDDTGEATEATPAGVASAPGATEGAASGGAETQEGDEAQNEEPEEEGAVVDE